MELKKYVSLALAGLMTVSMLAGCKNNTTGGDGQNGEVEVTPSSGYTQNIMDRTSDVTKALFNGETSTKLDDVVEHIANNIFISGIIHKNPYGDYYEVKGTDKLGHDGLTLIDEVAPPVEEAKTLMGDATYMMNCADSDDTNELIPTKAGKKTVYTLLRASRYLTDERINNELAAYMDEIAAAVNSQLEAKGMQDECTYTVSMSKADCIVFNKANRVWDSVLVGIVWQIEYTPETFA